MRLHVGLMLVVVSVVSSCAPSKTEAPSSGYVVVQDASARDSICLTANEAQVIQSVTNALEQIARRSTTAETLASFSRANMRRGIYTGNPEFTPIDSARGTNDFWLVVMPYGPPAPGQSAKAGWHWELLWCYW
jgi:hypothetical protein